MNFIRSHINRINWLTTGGFILSWLLMAIVLPVNILGFADSHSIYSVFNADEGCFELVVDHHEDAEGFHLMDEENDAHSFHNSCCFDDLALTFKKQEADFNLPLSYDNEGIESNFHSERFLRPVTLQEYSLPPPAVYQELRITRLLI
ncbi:hypothetical protein [Rhodohalobacter sp.]|uniref:hypothetical protein n=1 Tax=Rhodohalobacter sp. TaxID=1974210 RepID=UPI002ACD7DCD|nr:hypothetical protein [Rhodohalobacter sp.]MDZ7758305.1 hypothetical protein [Rhodohalobacter sp.]